MGAYKVTDWTDETVVELRRLHAEGLSASQIAKRIGGGCTRNSVIGKIYRLGMVRSAEAQKATISVANSSRARAAKSPQKPKVKSDIGIAGRGATFERAPVLPMPSLRDAAATGEPARIIDKRFGGCRWPISGEGADMTFCCGPRDEGKTYCAAHNPLAFSPTQPKPLMKLASIDRNVRRSSPYREEAA